jgi:hypothetical protein
VTSAHIRFAPEILRRLGEELNPSIDQGIVELVKNAYDADAHICGIQLRNVGRPGGMIRVVDDGRGMTAADMRSNWLILGRSRKAPSMRTKLGRVPAGNKGLGRLAALRLGAEAICTSRTKSAPATEHQLSIDWRRFDSAKTVEEVPIVIVSHPSSDPGVPGTTIELRDLRAAVTRTEVEALSRALVLLADPFGDDPTSFAPLLDAPEYPDLASRVENRYFDQALHHLTAELGPDGLASARVLDQRGRIIWKGSHNDIARKSDP